MKIIFFIPNIQYGGTEKVVTLLANELSKKQSVSILTLQNNFPLVLKNDNVEVVNLLETDISKYQMKYFKLPYLLRKYLIGLSDEFTIIAMGEVPIAVTALVKIFSNSNIRFIAGIRNFESKHFQAERVGFVRFLKKRLFSFLFET